MSEAFNLSGLLELDASDYVGETQDAADASDDLADSAEDTADSLFDIEPAGLAAGGALAGIGTAGQNALDDTRDMREELNRAGQAAGLTQDEMTDLTTSLSDATFSQEDAAATLGALTEQGVESEEQLEALAEDSDRLADAVGTSAESVAGDLGPAMAAVGDDVEDLAEIEDAVAVAVNETTLEFDELTRQMERNSDELEELGLDTEDTAALMGEFAEETGLSGTELRREFDEAMREADGDMEEFFETTEVTKDGFEGLRDEVGENEGAAEDYAESVEENTSFMDELGVVVDDAKLQFAEFLGPISAAAPAMQGVGAAAVTMSTINVSTLVPSFLSVNASMAPMLITIGAIAVAAGALAYVFQDELMAALDVVIDTLQSLMSGIMDEVEPVIEEFQETLSVWIDVIMDVVSAVADLVSPLTDELEPAVDTVISIVQEAADLFTDVFVPAFEGVTDAAEIVAQILRGDFSEAVEGAEELIGGFTDVVSDVFSEAVDIVASFPSDFLEAAKDIGSGIVDGLTSAISGAASEIKDTLTSPINSAIETINDTISGVSIDTISVGGETISTEIAGREIGGTLPEVEVGGQTLVPDDPIPTVETGGFIPDDTPAQLHAGERVLPDTQVNDRGEADFNPDSISDGFDDSRKADQIVRRLDELIRVVQDELDMQVELKDPSRRDAF